METTKMVESIVKFLGERKNILDYTIGDSNLILLEVNDTEGIDLAKLQESEGVNEALLQDDTVTLHIEKEIKEVLPNGC